MSHRWIVSACLLGLAACASPPQQPAGVLVVEDAERVRGCRPLGTVADDALDDLQKKAARLGGNVALMTPQRKAKGGYFGLQDYVTADVYRCEGSP
jgi:starvation-inducible outer membrane lipoprotein